MRSSVSPNKCGLHVELTSESVLAEGPEEMPLVADPCVGLTAHLAVWAGLAPEAQIGARGQRR